MSRGNMKYILLSSIYLLSQPRIILLQSKPQPTSQHLLFAFKIFFDQIFVHLCFMGGFNLWRCSYDQAVFSKFMPRIVLCGRPYDITASWQKTFHCFLILTHSFKNQPLSTSSCSNLNL